MSNWILLHIDEADSASYSTYHGQFSSVEAADRALRPILEAGAAAQLEIFLAEGVAKWGKVYEPLKARFEAPILLRASGSERWVWMRDGAVYGDWELIQSPLDQIVNP